MSPLHLRKRLQFTHRCGYSMVFLRGVMLHSEHDEAGDCRRLRQYSADGPHRKVYCAREVQWALSSLSRIRPEFAPVPNSPRIRPLTSLLCKLPKRQWR